MTSSSQRLDVVDCLRGFAIVSIMLLHNIEHFDLYFFPPTFPAWLVSLDKGIWDSAFFLFGGKSYLIFAMLFGVTFFIQSANREAKGEDFRPRFAWRMLLLLMFGLVNSAFYQGDILSIYAVLGLTLIPVARLPNKAVLAIAAVLLLQPYEWTNVLAALDHPSAKLADPASWAYFARADAYMKGSSITATWLGNLTNGKTAVLRWSWENARMFQIPALFMLGMLAGRKALFAATAATGRFWQLTFIGAALAFSPLYLTKTYMSALVPGDALRRPLDTIVSSWSNLALMLVIVSSFVLLFQTGAARRALRIFAPLGRMSLTSYLLQSIVGSSLYYGFGLGLYKFTGASMSLLIAIALASVQGCFSAWWLRHHKQGPLEAIWHRATWWGHRPVATPVSAA